MLTSAGTLGGEQSNSIPLFRLPGTSYGGGITIVRWDYATNKAVAAGSAPAFLALSRHSGLSWAVMKMTEYLAPDETSFS